MRNAFLVPKSHIHCVDRILSATATNFGAVSSQQQKKRKKKRLTYSAMRVSVRMFVWGPQT